MGRAKPLALDKNLRIRDCMTGGLGDILPTRPDDHGHMSRPGRTKTGKHMGQHGPPADGVKHLGKGRFHSRSLACGKDDGEAAAIAVSRAHEFGSGAFLPEMVRDDPSASNWPHGA